MFLAFGKLSSKLGGLLAAGLLVTRQSQRVFYTWTAQQQASPLEIVGGQGVRFEAADGSRWWDLGSMVWNAHLGQGHPAMRRALADAACRGLVAGPTTVYPDKARAGELLASIAPAGGGVPGRTPADVTRLPAALKARYLHMHKRDNLLYYAPPLIITQSWYRP